MGVTYTDADDISNRPLPLSAACCALALGDLFVEVLPLHRPQVALVTSGDGHSLIARLKGIAPRQAKQQETERDLYGRAAGRSFLAY